MLRTAVRWHPASRTEAVVAAVDRCAARACGDAGLAQHADALALPERLLQCAQLPVDVIQRRQLGGNQLVVALAEAVQVEHQPAEIAISELPCLAQKTQAAADAAPLAEAGPFARRG
jgi:hypothetical protein